MEHESDGDTYYNWCVRNSYQKRGLEDLEIGEGTETIQTTVLGQNTVKSPGDLKRLVVVIFQ